MYNYPGEYLEQGVHVAGGPLVLESHVSSMLLGVPRHAVGSVGVHFHLEDHAVILVNWLKCAIFIYSTLM